MISRINSELHFGCSRDSHPPGIMERLRVNGERLNNSIQYTCDRWGAIASSTGMRRLALSQEDKSVRDWLLYECRSIGCIVKVDEMGNIFAIRPGFQVDAKPIGMGSHLDTQPAGKFVSF